MVNTSTTSTKGNIENTDPLDTDDPWLILERHEILDRLEPEQVFALIPLAKGCRIAQVAATVDKSASTVYKWVQDENFSKALRLTVNYIYQHGLKSCAVASAQAAKTLLDITSSESAKNSDRVRAANILLEYGGRWQADNLEERIEELEKVIAAISANGNNQESVREEVG